MPAHALRQCGGPDGQPPKAPRAARVGSRRKARPVRTEKAWFGPGARRAYGMTIGGGGGVTPTPEELGLSGSGIRLFG